MANRVHARPLAGRRLRRRIFLSYKRGALPDETLVSCLYESLRHEHRVFFDKLIPVGDEWRTILLKEIDRSDFVVLLLSKDSAVSEYVEYEIDTAYRLSQARGGKPRILPVRVGFQGSLRYPLSVYLDRLNHIRWDSEADTGRVLRNLSSAILGGALPPAAPAVEITNPAVKTQVAPPAPCADPLSLERPDGTIDPQSAMYLRRQTDAICETALAREWERQRSGTLVIKAPRQMGKSSLLVRAARQAEKAGRRVAFLDFHLLDEARLAEPGAFFKGFCHWLADELDLPDAVEECWDSALGNVQLCTKYVRRRIIEALDRPLFLAMDEVDRMLTCPFRPDFFGMLRAWHNRRATDAAWRRVDLALVISTEPYLLIAEANQSPFNVGEVIALEDFTQSQIAELNQRHGAPYSQNQLQRLESVVGGHPYLVRQALYCAAGGKYTPEAVLARAADEDGPFCDHLRRHWVHLAEAPAAAAALREILRGRACRDELVLSRLRAGGLIARCGDTVRPRCGLYARYFGARLANG